MIKLETKTPIKCSNYRRTFSAENNKAQKNKSSHHQFGFGQSGSEICSNVLKNETIECSIMKKNYAVSNANRFNNKTASNVNFRGLAVNKSIAKLIAKSADDIGRFVANTADDVAKKEQEFIVTPKWAEKLNISKSKAWSLPHNKLAKKFFEMANSNQTVFDALFALLITCGLRPAAIMAQANDSNREKNKKAAEHSVASGIIGYGFARFIFTPIKKALDKIKKNPEKYAKKAKDFLTFNGKQQIGTTSRYQTFNMICNYGPQILTASFRSAITIALIPIIDKYVMNKIFRPHVEPVTKAELKEDPSYKFAFITPVKDDKKVFQNFAGVIK